MGQPISKYVLEQKRYKKQDLMEKFEYDNYEVNIFIKKLKQYGILKMVKNNSEELELSDLTDEEIEITDVDSQNDGYLYVFTFVGIFAIGDRVVKCLPKYLLQSNEIKKSSDELLLMKEIIRVLEKYNSKNQEISFANTESDNGKYSTISMMLYLLNDYYTNGLYFNEKSIVEINGEGEILWDNTINDTFAILSNNRPYYLELKTKNIVNDDEDYFRRLQMCILTECSKKLEELQLLEIFDMDKLYLSDEDIDIFGDEDYIVYRIEREKNAQFITQKLQILQVMEAYIKHRASFDNSDCIIIYGSNSFNLVWEDVCAEVFNNKLYDKISNITPNIDESYKNKSDNTLISIIEKPQWIYVNNKDYINSAKDTLKPDLISVYSKENKKVFGIFDAKYYNIILNEKLVKSQPGIQDLTKQYLYQLCYNDFIGKHNFDVVNAFLMPSDKENIVLLGKAKLDMFKNLCKPELKDILVIKLPTRKMYNYYINNKKIDINKEIDFL